jgi:mono/diheme cytochrome c family protein
MNNCAGAWTISAFLLMASLGMGYQFIRVSSDIDNPEDSRSTIVLESSEQALVLAEMRDFLHSVQKISQGIADNNPAAIAQAARHVGMTAVQAVPITLVGKLPDEFKKLGHNTHQAFDQLALDVEQMQDSNAAAAGLAQLMNHCIACHASYRIISF